MCGEKGSKRTNLEYVNLQKFNLQGADLREANLKEVNLKFSCLPLWCGAFDVNVDDDIFEQLVAHLCKVNIENPKYKKIQKNLLPIANKFLYTI